MRVCVDLNVWCAALLAQRAGRTGTAAQTIADAIRDAGASPAPVQLVISWGMLERLGRVLCDKLSFPVDVAEAATAAIAGYAKPRPSLALGGVGVLPIHHPEDRHVLETAWAGGATALVTADFDGFLAADAEVVIPGFLAHLRRADRRLHLIHPYPMAAWLRGETVEGFDPEF